MLLTLSGRRFIKIQYTSFPLFPMAYPFRIATQLQYYVKREKCKVNDVIFPSGCEARAINIGNKNMKIGIFTGGTSVRSKNIFTDISRYPTGRHELIVIILYTIYCCSKRRERSLPAKVPLEHFTRLSLLFLHSECLLRCYILLLGLRRTPSYQPFIHYFLKENLSLRCSYQMAVYFSISSYC